ncbi:DinB family protein [Tsukamurella sp. 1534]|uniref:DinB family protein n=1 Tax=Tsukamurella sp. 1534 TaxID=1151061 RepID=UPI000316E221|nr:DinB family protein [Tsukamurella sp. 1534]
MSLPANQPSLGADVLGAPLPEQFETFVDEHRDRLGAVLDGLTEEEARASIVPSRTTLLGLVKHATSVERIWFDGAVTGRTRGELGIGATVDDTFVLEPEDTVGSVLAEYRAACEASRRVTSAMDLDTVLPHHRFGPMPLRWVYLHLLREHAQHLGHADILREQLLARRS